MNFKPFMLFQTKFQNIDCPKCKYIYLRIDAHFHPKLAPQYILGRTSMSKYLTNLRKGKPENCMQQQRNYLLHSFELSALPGIKS